MKLFACMCNQPQRLVGRAGPRARGADRAAAGQPLGPRVHPGWRRAARAHPARSSDDRRRPRRAARGDRDRLRDRAGGPRRERHDRRHRQHAAVPVPALDVRADRPADQPVSTTSRRACSSTSRSTCAATSRAARPPSWCSTCSSRCSTTRATSTIRTCPSPTTRRALAATLRAGRRRARRRPARPATPLGNVALTNGRSMVVAHARRAAAAAPAVGPRRARRARRVVPRRAARLRRRRRSQGRLRGRAGEPRGADLARPPGHVRRPRSAP